MCVRIKLFPPLIIGINLSQVLKCMYVSEGKITVNMEYSMVNSASMGAAYNIMLFDGY